MFNEAGSHFKGMTNKCKQVWNKMKSMESGTNPRDPKKFSDKLLTLLQVEVASRELHKMAERVDKVRIIDTNKERSVIIDQLSEPEVPNSIIQAPKTDSDVSRAQND